MPDQSQQSVFDQPHERAFCEALIEKDPSPEWVAKMTTLYIDAVDETKNERDASRVLLNQLHFLVSTVYRDYDRSPLCERVKKCIASKITIRTTESES